MLWLKLIPWKSIGQGLAVLALLVVISLPGFFVGRWMSSAAVTKAEAEAAEERAERQTLKAALDVAEAKAEAKQEALNAALSRPPIVVEHIREIVKESPPEEVIVSGECPEAVSQFAGIPLVIGVVALHRVEGNAIMCCLFSYPYTAE